MPVGARSALAASSHAPSVARKRKFEGAPSPADVIALPCPYRRRWFSLRSRFSIFHSHYRFFFSRSRQLFGVAPISRWLPGAFGRWALRRTPQTARAEPRLAGAATRGGSSPVLPSSYRLTGRVCWSIVSCSRGGKARRHQEKLRASPLCARACMRSAYVQRPLLGPIRGAPAMSRRGSRAVVRASGCVCVRCF